MQSLTGIRSSIPQMNRYPEGPGIKALFHSIREIALILDKTVAPGYGYLKAGTVMAINGSTGGAGGYGKLVPYVPLSGDVVLGGLSAIGGSPVVMSSITDHVYVSLGDSYKYAVGDFLWADNDSDDGPISGGVISAIDRTTSTLYADITVAALTATNVTMAKKSYVYTMAGAGGNNVAAYILDKDVDTGIGETALGALTSVVVSNCILYKNSLYNLTAAAVTALGGIIDGRFFIMK